LVSPDNPSRKLKVAVVEEVELGGSRISVGVGGGLMTVQL
jgi:hypothetical protein